MHLQLISANFPEADKKLCLPGQGDFLKDIKGSCKN